MLWTVVLEKTLESPLDCKEIQPPHPKWNQSRMFIGRTDVAAEILILWPSDGRTDSLEKTLMLGKIEAGREGDDRGWDGCMASPTWWTWVWVNSGDWWWTERTAVLQFMGSQRVGHDWANELNWTDWNIRKRRMRRRLSRRGRRRKRRKRRRRRRRREWKGESINHLSARPKIFSI